MMARRPRALLFAGAAALSIAGATAPTQAQWIRVAMAATFAS
jgi:hypothetical protein